MVRALVFRGAAVGALAGLIAFVFARIFAEPVIQPRSTETPQPLTDPSGKIVYPGFDPDLLYWFRLYSVGAQMLLWGVLALGFAPLADRVLRSHGDPSQRDLASAT